MRTVLIFLLICLTLSIKGLSDTSDADLGSLLSGDFYSLLPDSIKDVKSQLTKLLTPSQPTTNPIQHAYAKHYRLASAFSDE